MTKTVRLGAGMAFWGDSVQPAIAMAERGDIDYLCCDHLAELTMSILSKQRGKNPGAGYTRDILDLLRGALETCVQRGIKIVTNAGGANPRACADAIAELARELGVPELRIAVVTGDDIETKIDELMHRGVPFANMDTGQQLAAVRDRLTHACVYTGCEGIVEALGRGADIVVCGRVTDIALYLGPLIHEFGWAADDWQRLGMATAVAHCIECGGQATGGLYAGGWQDIPDLENLGYPIQLGPDRIRITGATGKPRPATLKVNMGYRAGFIGEAQFTYTWPDAYAKAQRGLEFLKNRLCRAGFKYQDEIVEYIGQNSMWEDRVDLPDRDELAEIVVRYAARCPDATEARKVFTESVPLYNNGPAGVAGVGTRPPLKELYALWPCLVPREHIIQSVELVEV